MAHQNWFGVVDMNSKQIPRQHHIALLNSIDAINLMGGENLKVTRIDGQFSKTVFSEPLPYRSEFADYYMQRLDKMYILSWKAKGDAYAKSIGEIVEQTRLDGIPDVFLKRLTIIQPYNEFDELTHETVNCFSQFDFHPHPFKRGVFKRLKSRMPSQKIYEKMVEMRNREDLDEATKKRWRGVLLLNTPPKNLSNQELYNIWHNEPAALILKESRGRFELMEIAEVK